MNGSQDTNLRKASINQSSKTTRHGGRIIYYWRRPNAASGALRGGLRLLRLAEFVRYNRAAIGGPSKRSQ